MNRKRFVSRREPGAFFGRIVAPDGTHVFEYSSCDVGRLGNYREFSLWRVKSNGEAETRQVVCCFGGHLRTILRYLNEGEFINGEDDANWIGDEGVAALKQARRRFAVVPKAPRVKRGVAK